MVDSDGFYVYVVQLCVYVCMFMCVWLCVNFFVISVHGHCLILLIASASLFRTGDN